MKYCLVINKRASNIYVTRGAWAAWITLAVLYSNGNPYKILFKIIIVLSDEDWLHASTTIDL